MFYTIIALPNNLMTSTTQVASDFFSDLSPFIIIVFGILIGSIILEILIGTLRK